MKVAVIGSRNLVVSDFEKYLPENTTEIISGGARGVDSSAAEYARKKGITLTEIKPDYARYKRGAPLVRNKLIIEGADMVLAFWDGRSKGTKFVIEECHKTGKAVCVVMME